MENRAVLTVISGANPGDAVRLEKGFCRLLGRHLSESETLGIDRDGNRVLDGSAMHLMTEFIAAEAPATRSASVLQRGADIVLADDAVSRAHAMVFFDGSGVGVVDLASTNGTRINGTIVNSGMLKDGDVLTLGKTQMRVALQG